MCRAAGAGAGAGRDPAEDLCARLVAARSSSSTAGRSRAVPAFHPHGATRWSARQGPSAGLGRLGRSLEPGPVGPRAPPGPRVLVQTSSWWGCSWSPPCCCRAPMILLAGRALWRFPRRSSCSRRRCTAWRAGPRRPPRAASEPGGQVRLGAARPRRRRPRRRRSPSTRLASARRGRGWRRRRAGQGGDGGGAAVGGRRQRAARLMARARAQTPSGNRADPPLGVGEFRREAGEAQLSSRSRNARRSCSFPQRLQPAAAWLPGCSPTPRLELGAAAATPRANSPA